MFEHLLLIAFPSLQQQRAHDEEGESAAGAPQPHLGIGHAPTHQPQICPPREALGLRTPSPRQAAPQAATTRAADRHPAGRPMCQPGQPHHPHASTLAARRPLPSYLPGSPSPCPSATSLLVCHFYSGGFQHPNSSAIPTAQLWPSFFWNVSPCNPPLPRLTPQQLCLQLTHC